MGFGSFEEGDSPEEQSTDDEVDEEELMEINKQRNEGDLTTDDGGKDVSELLDAI